MNQVEGLPEGLEIVRIGRLAVEGEYSFESGGIYGWERPVTGGSKLIVRVLPGYVLSYEPMCQTYSVSRRFAEPKVKCIFVELNNTQDADTIEQILEHLKSKGIKTSTL